MNKFFTHKEGSAFLMSILILFSMIAVVFSVSKMVITSIQTSGIQSQSVIAYFSAEAGAERILYDLRKNFYVIDENSGNFYIGDNSLSNEATYQVYLKQWSPLTLISIGDFKETKRSVELLFN